MATIIKRLVSQDGVARKIQSIEQTASEALRGLDDEGLTVSFSTWDDGSELYFVCKVETPDGDPSSSAPPWRWWSPLFRTADELRVALDAMVTRRYGREAGSADATGETAAAS